MNDNKMPDFPKVRYASWYLEQLHPQEETYDKVQFLNQAFGIEVSGQTVTECKLPKHLLDQGVLLMTLSQAQEQVPELIQSYLHSVIDVRTDYLTEINAKLYTTGIFLYIPSHVIIDDTVHLILNQLAIASGDFVARVLVYVGQYARVSLLQTLQTIGKQSSKASVVIELIADTGSHVTYGNIDKFAKTTTTYINRQAKVLDHATVNWVNASFNDGQGITQLTSHALGEGATTKANVMAMTSHKQTQGFNTEIKNIGRHSVGHIYQRGVILNKSALVFNGVGRIIKGSKGADAQQESRILMLSQHARGEANPLLLIDENDVTAGHAASVSRVDEQQMYYLMSRGLDEIIARRLVIRGFMGKILSHIPTKYARDMLIDEIERKLQDEDK